MLTLFRNFFKSKIGVGITLGFLVLVAIAFASADVANVGTFGGVAGGDRVAVVGDERIDSAELSMQTSNALQQVQQENPTLTMEAFLAAGALDDVLDQMIRRTALAEWGREHGLRAGARLVDSELVQLPAFRGPDGSFDTQAFRAAIAQRGLNEEVVRQDLAAGLFARQLLTPVALAPVMPDSFALRYASLLREQREGAVAFLPAAAYAPEAAPTTEQLSEYYEANRQRFIRPERRVIRYATFGEEALGTLPPPTEEQIAQAYRGNRVDYAPRETRSFTQLVVPTQAAAQAIVNQVQDGTSLAQAAESVGLRTSEIGPVTQAELTRLTSSAVANAGFGTSEGTVAAPARGELGWYVLRVDDIETRPARSLAEVRGELSEALVAEQRRAAYADLLTRIDERMQDGATLTEIASDLGVTLTSTRPATADGMIYGVDGETIPPLLAPALETAFDMAEGEPQLAEVEAGNQYLIFDIASVTPSAVAPLADIREQVATLWRRDRGAAAARLAADRVMQRMANGQTLAQALAAEEPELPAPNPLSIGREQLAEIGEVPAPLALFFSMAEGSVKKLADAGNEGWFVVQVEEIEPGQVAANDQLVAATLQQLSAVTAEEYVEQFTVAVQNDVEIERNPEAIAGVAAQLTGRAN